MPLIGPTIRRLRLRRKLSQEKLAEAGGCSDEYVSLLETGKRNNPAAAVISGFAMALATTPDAMFREAGWLPQPAEIEQLSSEETRFIEALRGIHSAENRGRILENATWHAETVRDIDLGVQRDQLRLVAEDDEAYHAEEEDGATDHNHSLSDP